MKEKIWCTLVDEEESGLNMLKNDLELLSLKVERIFIDPEKFLFEAGNLRSRVIFLDVDMPGLDGFECARRLKGKKIIFVSAKKERAYEAFELDQVVDFVPKPLNKARLKAAVDKLLVELNHDSGIVYFKFDQEEFRIHRDRIVIIRSEKNTGNKELVLTNPPEAIRVSDEPFEKILSRLNHENFIQISKYDAINVMHVSKKIGVDEVEMNCSYPVDGNNQKRLRVSIGDSFRANFNSRF
jgi:DNA-binding LytR/AlgR family response regulator